MKTPRLKIISAVAAILFLFSNIAWPHPAASPARAYALRGLSLSERSRNEFTDEFLAKLFPDITGPDRNVALAEKGEELAAHGITPAQIERQLALRKTERAKLTGQAQAPERTFVHFPESVAADKALIETGRRREALSKLGIVIAAGGEGSRLLEKLIAAGGLTKGELEVLTKVTTPVSPIMKFSTLELQLRIIAYINKKYNVNIPVCVIMSPLEANEPRLRRFLSENNNFGISQLLIAVQDVNPTYKNDADAIALKNDGSIAFNPDGTGGTLKALVKDGVIDKFRQILGKNGRFLFLNGDNVIDTELIFTASGAAKLNPDKEYINFTYEYPHGIDAKIGVPCVIKEGQDGTEKLAVVEFKERPKVSGLQQACDAALATGDLQGNGNIVVFSLRDLEEKVQTLPEHVQLDKDSFGVSGRTDKIEVFITDMAERFPADETLLIGVRQHLGIKDLKALGDVRQALILEGQKRAKEVYGATVEVNGCVEFAPDSDPEKISIGPGLTVGHMAGLYLGGSATIKIGKNVTIADNATVKIIGDGTVIIEDGAILWGDIVIGSKAGDIPTIVTQWGGINVGAPLVGALKGAHNMAGTNQRATIKVAPTVVAEPVQTTVNVIAAAI